MEKMRLKPTAKASAQLKKKSVKTNTKPDPTRYGDWVKNGRCIDF